MVTHSGMLIASISVRQRVLIAILVRIHNRELSFFPAIVQLSEYANQYKMGTSNARMYRVLRKRFRCKRCRFDDGDLDVALHDDGHLQHRNLKLNSPSKREQFHVDEPDYAHGQFSLHSAQRLTYDLAEWAQRISRQVSEADALLQLFMSVRRRLLVHSGHGKREHARSEQPRLSWRVDLINVWSGLIHRAIIIAADSSMRTDMRTTPVPRDLF